MAEISLISYNKFCAAVVELADALDSKSGEVNPRVGSTPTSGIFFVPRWWNWQTRMVQVHVGATPWRFKSSPRQTLLDTNKKKGYY